MSATHYRSDDNLSGVPVGHGNNPGAGPLPVTDTVSKSAAITPTDSVPNPAVALSHRLAVVCTVAGNVKVGFMDGSTFTFPVIVGLNLMPFRVAQVFVTGTTATATYAGLK